MLRETPAAIGAEVDFTGAVMTGERGAVYWRTLSIVLTSQ